MNSRALLLLLVAALQALAGGARAEPLVADLDNHLVAITTGFTGTGVVLFGATDGPGDIIVIVRGPERDMIVRRKSRVLGVWANTRSVSFVAVPGYYAALSSRPLDEIAPPPMQALHQIGLANLRLNVKDAARRSPADIAAFRGALIGEQQREGLYAVEVGKVNFLGERLFRATIDLPRNVPTGSYLVEVLLVREGVVVSGQTTPLIVSQAGIDAEVNDFANRRAFAYGVIAVFGAAAAGWLASLPFRNA